MSHNITIEGGTSVRLPTAGKYCDRDIVVTATGGGGGDSDELAKLLTNKLTSLDSNATSVRQFAFRGATALTSVNLPKATSIETNAFYGSNIVSVNLPLVKSIGGNAFTNCGQLPYIVLPSLTSGDSHMFRYCYKLLTIDLPVIKNIVAYMFGDCRTLTAVILRSETMCTLAATSGFYNCYHFHGTKNSQYNPDGLKDGYIYVPKALLSDEDETTDYRRATNWSTFASQFRAIEDYPEICGG